MENQKNYDNIEKEIFNFNNYVKNSLIDGKLSFSEKNKIYEYLTNKNKITNQTYKNWNELAKETKILLQNEVGTIPDGKIGKDTIRKLKNYQYIEQKNEAINVLKDNKEAIIKKGNTLIENNKVNIKDNTSSEWNLGISSHNDGMIINTGTDTGNTAGINFSLKNDDYKLNSDYEIYTTGEQIIHKKSGKKHTSYDNANRLDQINGNIKKSIYQEKFEDGSSINLYVGGGITGVGKFGGDFIQNTTHKIFGKNLNLSTYEEANGVTPTANISIDGQKNISNIKGVNFYTKEELDLQKSLNNGVGEDNIKFKAKLGLAYEGFDGGAYADLKYREGVTDSNTISNSLKNEPHLFTGVYTGYTKDDTTVYLELGVKPKNQIILGINQKF